MVHIVASPLLNCLWSLESREVYQVLRRNLLNDVSNKSLDEFRLCFDLGMGILHFSHSVACLRFQNKVFHPGFSPREEEVL